MECITGISGMWNEFFISFLFYFIFLFFLLVSYHSEVSGFLCSPVFALFMFQGLWPCFFSSMGRLIWGLAKQTLDICNQKWCMLGRYTCWKMCSLMVRVVLGWPLKDRSSAIGHVCSWNFLPVYLLNWNIIQEWSVLGVYVSHAASQSGIDCGAVSINFVN
jgi:hypothetical protein